MGTMKRPFLFSTIQQDDSYSVTIQSDGLSPYGASVSRSAPNAEIRDQPGARVRATGTLRLSSRPNDPRVIILFTGVFHTREDPASLPDNQAGVDNVIIASLGSRRGVGEAVRVSLASRRARK
jgi:hypothetical protein